MNSALWPDGTGSWRRRRRRDALDRRLAQLERRVRDRQTAATEDIAVRCQRFLASLGRAGVSPPRLTWDEIEAAKPESRDSASADRTEARQSVALGLLRAILAVRRRMDQEGLD